MEAALAIRFPKVAAQERVHNYPFFVSLVWQGGLLLGVAFSVLRWGGTSLRAAVYAGGIAARIIDLFFPSVAAFLSRWPLPRISWPIPAVGLEELLGAHLALFIALLAVYFLYDLFPALSLAPDGVRVSSHGQWVFIPWGRIRRLVSTEAYAGERLIVFVELDTERLGPKWRLAGLIFGVGPRPGFLLTTDLRDFDQLVVTLANRLMEGKGDQPLSEVIGEDHFSPLFKLTLDLPNFLLQIIMPYEREIPSYRQSLLVWVMLLVSSWGLLSMSRALATGDARWSLIPLFFLASLEIAVGATALWAISDLYAGYPNWRQISTIYPFSQISRLWFFPFLGLAVAVPLPAVLLVLLGLGVATWVGYLAARFTQVYYNLTSLRSAIPGGIMPALYFILLWEVFLFS
ncbi:MAG: hypothetical protein HYX86_06825 [Chloroflexi bacterium]|nr:hypothetical protein [Chloroflexota bacterium]